MTDIDLAHLRFLDINEIKNLLAISRSSVYRLLDSGELKSYRINRYRRVLATDLEAFVKALVQPVELTMH